MPVEHPLLDLLRRVTATAPTIRKWSQYWADAHLLPLLRDIRAATDQPDLDAPRLNQYLRDLRAVLAQRDDTRSLAATPDDVGGTGKAIDDAGPPLASHVPLSGRITNEIRGLADKLIESLGVVPQRVTANAPEASATDPPGHKPKP